MDGHMIVVNCIDAIDYVWELMLLHVASESCCCIALLCSATPSLASLALLQCASIISTMLHRCMSGSKVDGLRCV